MDLVYQEHALVQPLGERAPTLTVWVKAWHDRAQQVLVVDCDYAYENQSLRPQPDLAPAVNDGRTLASCAFTSAATRRAIEIFDAYLAERVEAFKTVAGPDLEPISRSDGR